MVFLFWDTWKYSNNICSVQCNPKKEQKNEKACGVQSFHSMGAVLDRNRCKGRTKEAFPVWRTVLQDQLRCPDQLDPIGAWFDITTTRWWLICKLCSYRGFSETPSCGHFSSLAYVPWSKHIGWIIHSYSWMVINVTSTIVKAPPQIFIFIFRGGLLCNSKSKIPTLPQRLL